MTSKKEGPPNGEPRWVDWPERPDWPEWPNEEDGLRSILPAPGAPEYTPLDLARDLSTIQSKLEVPLVESREEERSTNLVVISNPKVLQAERPPEAKPLTVLPGNRATTSANPSPPLRRAGTIGIAEVPEEQHVASLDSLQRISSGWPPSDHAPAKLPKAVNVNAPALGIGTGGKDRRNADQMPVPAPVEAPKTDLRRLPAVRPPSSPSMGLSPVDQTQGTPQEAGHLAKGKASVASRLTAQMKGIFKKGGANTKLSGGSGGGRVVPESERDVEPVNAFNTHNTGETGGGAWVTGDSGPRGSSASGAVPASGELAKLKRLSLDQLALSNAWKLGRRAQPSGKVDAHPARETSAAGGVSPGYDVHRTYTQIRNTSSPLWLDEPSYAYSVRMEPRQPKPNAFIPQSELVGAPVGQIGTTAKTGEDRSPSPSSWISTGPPSAQHGEPPSRPSQNNVESKIQHPPRNALLFESSRSGDTYSPPGLSSKDEAIGGLTPASSLEASPTSHSTLGLTARQVPSSVFKNFSLSRIQLTDDGGPSPERAPLPWPLREQLRPDIAEDGQGGGVPLLAKAPALVKTTGRAETPGPLVESQGEVPGWGRSKEQAGVSGEGEDELICVRDWLTVTSLPPEKPTLELYGDGGRSADDAAERSKQDGRFLSERFPWSPNAATANNNTPAAALASASGAAPALQPPRSPFNKDQLTAAEHNTFFDDSGRSTEFDLPNKEWPPAESEMSDLDQFLFSMREAAQTNQSPHQSAPQAVAAREYIEAGAQSLDQSHQMQDETNCTFMGIPSLWSNSGRSEGQNSLLSTAMTCTSGPCHIPSAVGKSSFEITEIREVATHVQLFQHLRAAQSLLPSLSPAQEIGSTPCLSSKSSKQSTTDRSDKTQSAKIHDLQALEEAGKRAGLRQLQQEGILIVENCTMQSASESPEEGTGRMTVDIRLPQKALSSVSPGQSFDVILVASGHRDNHL